MSILKSRVAISKPFKAALTVTALSTVLLAVLVFQLPVQAQTDQDLAWLYAPVLHFTQAEKFYPTSVDYIIGSSSLKQRTSTGASLVIDSAPTPENLGSHTESDLFLDNNDGTFENIASDYGFRETSLGYTAYVHFVRNGASTVIQYWLFYAFNNGPLNEHQGDIEVIEVFLDAGGDPETMLCSQHGAGESAEWGDVEKSNGHPVVYVAQGSHANYFRSYQGKIGVENDIVGSDGKTIAPNDLNLVVLGEPGNHPVEQGWLDFSGRWGYWGTDEEAALGMAGPYGPVFNQNGIRWEAPQAYLAATLPVNGTYFILAWLLANFLLFFLIYTLARGAWKGWCIYRLRRSGGLMVRRFLRGRSAVGFGLTVAAIVITLVALFLPWYAVTASSQTGPLAQERGVELMTMDGVNGLKVNMFLSPATPDSSSGYVSLFSAQMPFALIFAAGIVLIALDIIGLKNGKSFAKKLWIGIITVLMPIILILIFVSILPAFLPLAGGLVPGQGIPQAAVDMVHAIAGSPIAGTTSAWFETVGFTTVSWGLGIGAYLFIVAAILRLVAGLMFYLAREPRQLTQEPVYVAAPPPPPPPSADVSALVTAGRGYSNMAENESFSPAFSCRLIETFLLNLPTASTVLSSSSTGSGRDEKIISFWSLVQTVKPLALPL